MDLSESFLKHFQDLKDPRIENHPNKRHKLSDILVITILAVICGAEGWVEVEQFGKARRRWLKKFLELPCGIPSHDTFGRVFSLLDPKQLEESFLSWIRSLVKSTNGELIAIDGKTVRNSHDSGKKAIHMVSAWAVNNRLILGQVKTDEKSNEITAIVDLLQLLDIKGSTVTIDAMGCQKNISQYIIDHKADFVLSLKGNQGTLHEDVKTLFFYAWSKDFKKVPYDYYEEVDKDHGRIEKRQYWLIKNDEGSYHLGKRWPGLKGIGASSCTRITGKKHETETRFYLLSFGDNAERFAHAARNHWNIEINVHWSLDVSFHEDLCCVRIGHAAENFSVLRRIALNLLKQETTAKIGIAAKRKKAGWDHEYLKKILEQLAI